MSKFHMIPIMVLRETVVNPALVFQNSPSKCFIVHKHILIFATYCKQTTTFKTFANQTQLKKLLSHNGGVQSVMRSPKAKYRILAAKRSEGLLKMWADVSMWYVDTSVPRILKSSWMETVSVGRQTSTSTISLLWMSIHNHVFPHLLMKAKCNHYNPIRRFMCIIVYTSKLCYCFQRGETKLSVPNTSTLHRESR